MLEEKFQKNASEFATFLKNKSSHSIFIFQFMLIKLNNKRKLQKKFFFALIQKQKIYKNFCIPENRVYFQAFKRTISLSIKLLFLKGDI